jgi:anti-sigma factor RsiW
MTVECFSSIDKEGLAGLSRYLHGQVEELDKVRRTPERGTWANSFPWWKIVAAAIWLGVTAFAVWQAVTFGAPWWSIAMIIFVALVGTILIALGC